MKDRKKCIISWSIVTLLCVIVTILYFVVVFVLVGYFPGAGSISSLLIAIDIVIVIFWIASFSTKYRTLKFENHIIEIYAGMSNHYIKIDGELKDEFKGLSYVPITLKCNIDNNIIDVVISGSNHIKLKINDELIK